jgi:hypothetical protein
MMGSERRTTSGNRSHATSGNRSHARGAGLALLFACSLLTLPAFGAPTAAEKETARSLMKSARDKRKGGDLQGALKDFSAARAIMNVTTTGLEVGKTQLELGLLVEARDTLLEVTRLPEQPGEPKPIREARVAAKELAAEILPRIPSARIEIPGSPDLSGVVFTVDGVKLVRESVGVPLKLNPGDHVAVARRGEGEQKAAFRLKEGESKSVTLDVSALPPLPKPPPPPLLQRFHPIVPIGVLSAGVAAIGGGIMGGVALAMRDSIVPRCVDSRCPPETWSDIDTAHGVGTASTVMFAVAGACALGAGAGLLFLPRKPGAPPASAMITPWIGAGTAGAVVGIRH